MYEDGFASGDCDGSQPHSQVLEQLTVTVVGGSLTLVGSKENLKNIC